MVKLNGMLMSGDIEIARVDEGTVTPINEKLMPIYLKRTGNMENWLAERAIDKHRTNSRLLKKVLRLTSAEDVEVSLKVHAATITDNYWFKEDGCNLCYEDIKFKYNMFDKLALCGDPDSFNNEESPTPELTNTGSFEKCWRIKDGQWWIYKQGNDDEIFSELFIYHLGKAMGFDMAYYEKEDGYIKSPDFTNQANVNFEPMHSYVDDDEDYQKSFEILDEVCPEAAVNFVKMIYLDTICFNMDRHTKNYGVLRDIKTGKIVSLAPNFDNNIALISRGYPQNMERYNDRLVKLFAEFVNGNDFAKSVYLDIEPPTEEMIKQAIANTGFEVDEETIIGFIQNGDVRIQELTEEQSFGQGMQMD